MSKSLRVRQELDTLKPRLEEAVTTARTLRDERFPEEKLEEVCDKAQDSLELLRHRIKRYSEAFHVFQGVADGSAEDEALYQKMQPGIQKLVEDAEEMGASLDRKIKRSLKMLSEKVQEQKVSEIEKQRMELEKLKATAEIELQKQKQEAVLNQADAANGLTKERDEHERVMKERDLELQKKKKQNVRNIELRRLANQKELEQQRLDLEGRLQEVKIKANDQGHVRMEEGETNVKLPKLTT